MQTRTEAGGDQVVVSDAVIFNARQSVRDQLLPYTDTGLAYSAPAPSLPHTRQEYDPLGRVLRVVNPDGTFQSVLYKPLVEVHADEEDNEATSPNADTPKTLSYDGLGRVVTVEELITVNGQTTPAVTHYDYDRLGNLTRMTDPQNNVKVMEYDALSRRVRTVDPDKGETRYVYDDAGNLIRSEDAKGQVVEFTYDTANRPLMERWTFDDGRPAVVNATYHYDADLSPAHVDAQNTLGQVAYIEDQAGRVYFSYDPRGNITGQIREFSQEGLTFVTEMAYDAMDRMTRVVYPDGFAVDYSFNERGLLQRIPTFVDDITYTPSGQRASLGYANGAQTTYRYDARLRLQKLQTSSGQTVLQDLTYTFDGVGNLTAIADARPAAPGGRTAANDQSQSFRYDSLYRLIKATGSYGQIDFGYDQIGNMVQKSSTVADPRLNLGTLRYGENGAGPHALTGVGPLAYSYDANGNLEQKGTTHYRWDARNRLLAVEEGQTVSTFVYNAEAQRVKQTVQRSGVTTTTLYIDEYGEVRGDKLILYVYDNEQRLAQVSKPFDRARLLRGFSDQPQSGSPAGERFWYINDHLDGTSFLLDQSGNAVAEVAYYPFGLTRYEKGSLPTPYGYAGKELDSSGLHYFNARYYDSLTGRFISVDPIYEELTGAPQKQDSYNKYLLNPQLWNGYAYAAGNPLKFIDPNGKEIIISKGLRSCPGFMKAWNLFKSTQEGQRLMKSLDSSGWKIYVRASRVGVRDAKVGNWTSALGQQYTGPAEGKNLKNNEAAVLINIDEHMKSFRTSDRLIKELADTTHHELRHAEGDIYAPMFNAADAFFTNLGLPDLVDNQREIHRNLDNYNKPSDDARNAAFQKEIGL